jgi:4-hydroxyproline epimerase
MLRVQVIDSHTAGEPTRLVLEGAPELGGGSLAARAERFARDHDDFRSAVVLEPRGSDVLVGALLTPPVSPAATAGVIFFNNVGILGMCGHGTIGVIASLAHLGRIEPGEHRLDTPVGTVRARLREDGGVEVENVAAHRSRAGVEVPLAAPVAGLVRVRGDVAWGGNWFFLCHDHGLPVNPSSLPQLQALATAIRTALAAAGVRGDDGAAIDHIELVQPLPPAAGVGARGFVLCPGDAYDRSPCGTGTSAALACAAADGRLAPGTAWRQESVIGSSFDARYRLDDAGRVIPTIVGRAFVTAETTLLFDAADPFRLGIRLTAGGPCERR